MFSEKGFECFTECCVKKELSIFKADEHVAGMS